MISCVHHNASMADKPKPSEPATIAMTQTTQIDPAMNARAAFKQLALRKVAPTPDNYAKFYAETAQVKLGEVLPVWAVIESLARELRDDPARSNVARAIIEALGKSDWEGVRRGFRSMLREPGIGAATESTAGSSAARSPALATDSASGHETILAFKDLFKKTIDYLVDERAGYSQENVGQAKALVALAEIADAPAKVSEVALKMKSFWMKLELRGEGPEAIIRHLHGLLMLLLQNVGDLAPDDRWIQQEVERIQALLGTDPSPKALAQTERALKEFGFRQTSTRAGIDEANAAIRDMMAVFIDRLGAVTASTGEYSTRLAGYSESIRGGRDLRDLAGVLEHLVKDTNLFQADMSSTHTELDATRRKVAEVEAHVQELETKLSAVSELVREDPLTRALNRRGLEQQYAVESARSRRRAKPLAIAMLDLDDFKKLNDRLGHQAGDAALRRLVDVAKHAIRPTDSLARYGGEEFVVLLPEADAESGAIAINRVLSDLVRRPMVWNGEEATITFSAGITVMRENESFDAVIARADAAMYEAKRAGKNRVMTARD